MPFMSSIEGKVAFGRGGTSVIPLAGSLFFNGDVNTTLICASGVLISSGAYTIECWFYNSANWTTNRGLLGGSNENGKTGCMSLFFGTSTSITTDKFGGGGQRTYTMASPISLNAWHYFTLVRNASLVETIFIDGVKATGAEGGTSISGGQQVNIIDYNGFSQDICKYYGGQWTGYITNMRIVVGTAVYDPTASTMSVPNKAPLAVVNPPNTKYLMLGANVTTDSSFTQHTVTSNNVTQTSSIKPF
jgi:hypothetical protein